MGYTITFMFEGLEYGEECVKMAFWNYPTLPYRKQQGGYVNGMLIAMALPIKNVILGNDGFHTILIFQK